MPIYQVPNLQQVTGVGATSTIATTFSGGLSSRNAAGSGSAILGDGLFATMTGTNSVGVGYFLNDGGKGNQYYFGVSNSGVGTLLESTIFGTNIDINSAGTLCDGVSFNAMGLDSSYRSNLNTPAASAYFDFVGSSNTIRGSTIAGVGSVHNIGTTSVAEATDPFDIAIVGIGSTIGNSTSYIASLGFSPTVAASVTHAYNFGYLNTFNHSNTALIGDSLTSVSANDYAFGNASSLYRFLGTFPNNNTLKFGSTDQGEIKYNGNLVINPASTGSGILYVGDGATGANIKAGFLGLADSVVSTSRVIDMDCTSTAILRGLSSVITHTGTLSAMRALLFSAIHSGSSATGPKAPIGSLITATLAIDTTGSINVLGTLTSAGASCALATIGGGQVVNFANKFQITSAAGNTTDQTINAASIWGTNPGTFAGAVGTVNRWAGLFSGDVQVNSDMKLLFEGADTVKGDTYMSYVTSTTSLDTYVDAVKNTSGKSDRVRYFVPPTDTGISKGVAYAMSQGYASF